MHKNIKNFAKTKICYSFAVELINPFKHNIMNKIYLFCFLFICFSCARPKQTTVAESDHSIPEVIIEDSVEYYAIKDNRIVVDLKKPQQASLLNYFSKIELIPLETSDNVIVGSMKTMIFYKNRYYILDFKQQTVMVFDQTGKYILKIGKLGQGPGEYWSVLEFFVNPFTGYVELLDPLGFIFRYDLSGKFIEKSTRFFAPSSNPLAIKVVSQLIALNEKLYIFHSVDHKYKISYCDWEKGIYRGDFEMEESISTPWTCFYEYRGQWYFYFQYSNHVYEIGVDSLRQAYAFDFGKLTYDIRKTNYFKDYNSKNMYEKLDVVNRFPYRLPLQGQNNRYVLAEIRVSQEKYANLMYDKSTHESKYIEKFNEVERFRPYIVTNGYVLAYCLDYELPKYVNREILDEKNRQIYDAIINAKEEQNPVIIKYYF